MKWIFQSAWKDLCLLYGIGLLMFTLSSCLPWTQEGYEVIPFIIFVLIDIGHQYTTGWRVLANRPSLQKYAVKTLLITMIAVWFWLYWRLPYFWHIWNYFTFYHYVRQSQGLYFWYGKINKHLDKTSGVLIFILMSIPFFAFHFRPDASTTGDFYARNLFLFPNSWIFEFLKKLWLLVFIFAALREARKFLNTPFQWNIFLSLLGPGTLTALCFFYGENYLAILSPLLIVHGLSYMFLVGISVRKIQPTWGSLSRIMALIFLTSFLAGIIDDWATDFSGFQNQSPSLAYLILTTLFSAPSFWHYIMDARIWKKIDPDADLIYSHESR